jgi:hypothetical protein
MQYPAGPYSGGSPNTKSAFPDVMAMCCRASIANDTGLACTRPASSMILAAAVEEQALVAGFQDFEWPGVGL